MIQLLSVSCFVRSRLKSTKPDFTACLESGMSGNPA